MDMSEFSEFSVVGPMYKFIADVRQGGLGKISPLVAQIQREGVWSPLKASIVPGITVACMCVPQSLSYALLAGLPPIYGLYASTFTILVYALLGTSQTLAIGPVALVSLLTKGTIDGELPEDAPESEVIELAITLAFMVGCLQVLFGFVGLGGVTSFLSHDVLIGFTSGSAVIIAFSQMKYVFGISIGRHHYPWETIADVFSNLENTDGNELAVSISCLFLLIAMKVWRKRNPAPQTDKDKEGEVTWKKVVRQICSMSALVVVAIYTPMSAILDSQGVKLNIVGKQPEGIPAPTTPTFSKVSTSVTISALVIAIIGFLESFAVARSTEPKDAAAKGLEVKANQDLVAIGLSNAVGSFFNAYPVAGSFGRTAVSARSGARSTISGAITACFVLFVLLVMMPVFEFLPYCALACIIEVAVVGLIDIHGLKLAWRVSKPEFTVSVITFVGVLGLGIELGVLIGAGISLAIVLRRAATPNTAVLGKVPDHVPKFGGTWRDTTRFKNSISPPESIILRVDGPIFFANCATIQNRCIDIVKSWSFVEEEIAKGDLHATHPSLPTNWTDKKNVKDGDDDDDDDKPSKKKETKSEEEENLAKSDALTPIKERIHMIHMLDEILSSRHVRLGLAGPHGNIRDMLKRSDKAEKKHSHHLSERCFATIDQAITGLEKVSIHGSDKTSADSDDAKENKEADVELGDIEI